MNFPGHWVGCDEPILKASAHMILHHLISPFGEYVKDSVYMTLVTCLNELKLRIVAAVVTFPLQILESTWREIEYCLGISIILNHPVYVTSLGLLMFASFCLFVTEFDLYCQIMYL